MRNMLVQNVSLSTNLKRLRKESGLSQEALTAKINLLGSLLERSAYARIELGQRNIKVTDLVALQQVYNVDFAEFFKGIEPHE
jgi:transcriptional regulator with XRE-family HTH domain